MATLTWVDVVGYIAATCTTLAYLPQVIMVWRSKNATGVSWGMVILLCVGLSLWLLYGFAIHRLPVILVNGLTLTLTGSMVFLKLKYDARMRAEGLKG
jgi:MtN3 and saliva related transmembrane protein